MKVENLEFIAKMLGHALQDAMFDRDIFREMFENLNPEVDELREENTALKLENDRLRNLGLDSINTLINK